MHFKTRRLFKAFIDINVFFKKIILFLGGVSRNHLFLEILCRQHLPSVLLQTILGWTTQRYQNHKNETRTRVWNSYWEKKYSRIKIQISSASFLKFTNTWMHLLTFWKLTIWLTFIPMSCSRRRRWLSGVQETGWVSADLSPSSYVPGTGPWQGSGLYFLYGRCQRDPGESDSSQIPHTTAWWAGSKETFPLSYFEDHCSRSDTVDYL